MTRTLNAVVVAAFVACGFTHTASAADTAAQARVGEVRAFAVAPGNADAVAALHRDGWLEADGRVLPVAGFQALYREIGRAWTASGVAEDRFAVPALRDTTQRAAFWDNPYGVLSQADLVTSGNVRKTASRRNPLSYWIFVGAPVAVSDAGASR